MGCYNPEKSAWRGRSYRKGGQSVRALRDAFVEGEEVRVEEVPAPEPVFYVVEVTEHLPVKRHECRGAAEAIVVYKSVRDAWTWDDRFLGVHIEDSTGRKFRPSADLSGISGPHYKLPLIEVQVTPTSA